MAYSFIVRIEQAFIYWPNPLILRTKTKIHQYLSNHQYRCGYFSEIFLFFFLGEDLNQVGYSELILRPRLKIKI